MGMGAGSDATRGHRLQELLLINLNPPDRGYFGPCPLPAFNPERLGGIGQSR